VGPAATGGTQKDKLVRNNWLQVHSEKLLTVNYRITVAQEPWHCLLSLETRFKHWKLNQVCALPADQQNLYFQ